MREYAKGMQLVRETLFKGATLCLACRCKHPSVGESEVKVTQSCLTLCDPIVYTVHGILQVRVTGKQNMANIYTYEKYTHTRDYSDQISRSVVSDSWRPHESQHARPPCPSPTPGVH